MFSYKQFYLNTFIDVIIYKIILRFYIFFYNFTNFSLCFSQSCTNYSEKKYISSSINISTFTY